MFGDVCERGGGPLSDAGRLVRQMPKYDVEIDLSIPNNSHTYIVELVGGNKRVLDVGCATGYLARALRQRGCVVSGFESDPEAAEVARADLDTLVVGDLEETDLAQAFAGHTFDVVVFGDVLEHLREPLTTLRQAWPLLAEGGSVVASIPNIAHGSVRLALLQGRFQYQDLGLLDHTHLRFFTRDSVEEMFRLAGLAPVELRRTTTGLFETVIDLNEVDFSPEVVETVLADPEALTFQFVLRAVRDDAGAAIADLHAREEEQRRVIEGLRRQLDAAHRASAAAGARVEELEKATADSDRRLADASEEVSSLRRELAEVRAELDRVLLTRTMRYTRLARQAYGRIRRLTS